jgi:hypothetical protein
MHIFLIIGAVVMALLITTAIAGILTGSRPGRNWSREQKPPKGGGS